MGMFSWYTSDRNKRIVADKSKDIFMTGSDHQIFHQKKPYEGYGVFGGKDFFEYLAELNDLPSDRSKGIDLYFSGKRFESPKLLSEAENIIAASKYGAPKKDPKQGM